MEYAGKVKLKAAEAPAKVVEVRSRFARSSGLPYLERLKAEGPEWPVPSLEGVRWSPNHFGKALGGAETVLRIRFLACPAPVRWQDLAGRCCWGPLTGN